MDAVSSSPDKVQGESPRARSPSPRVYNSTVEIELDDGEFEEELSGWPLSTAPPFWPYAQDEALMCSRRDLCTGE